MSRNADAAPVFDSSVSGAASVRRLIVSPDHAALTVPAASPDPWILNGRAGK
jgi:hypothetical protein